MTPPAGRPDLLVYSANFAPELTGVGRYTGELAFGLAARGARVEAIAAPPHYPGWHVRPPYSPWRYVREEMNGVSVDRCPMLLHKAGQGIWRLIAPLSFALASKPVALWRILRGRPRTVLCVEPTLFIAPIALLAAKLCGARTVLHIQDLEIDAAFAVGHLKSGGLVSRLAFAFERGVLGAFDRVVTISNQMEQRLLDKGVPRDRLSVVRNWVDTSKIHPLGRPSAYREELGIGADDFVVLYSGQIGPKQALHVAFEAAQAMKDSPKVKFVIAGDGPLKPRFVEQFGGLPNVTILDLQPEARLNEFLNLADCHILPQDPAVKDLVLPSKLGGMLASGKQILVMADDDSELAHFLGDSCIRIPPSQARRLPEVLGELARDRVDTGLELRQALARQLAVEFAFDAFSDILALGGRERVRPAQTPAQA